MYGSRFLSGQGSREYSQEADGDNWMRQSIPRVGGREKGNRVISPSSGCNFTKKFREWESVAHLSQDACPRDLGGEVALRKVSTGV